MLKINLLKCVSCGEVITSPKDVLRMGVPSNDLLNEYSVGQCPNCSSQNFKIFFKKE